MRILVHGATGRMGQAVIRLASHNPHIILAAATTRASHPLQGVDAGEQAGVGLSGVHVAADAAPDDDIDVVIDFTNADGFAAAIKLAGRLQAALVSGTTGLNDEHFALLNGLASRQPVLWAPNMSVAMTVLQDLVTQAAQTLKEADVEITELHHRFKKDAPSGSALALARLVAKARGQGVDQVVNRARVDHQGPRKNGEIGMATLRGGDAVGDHEVAFHLEGEVLKLSHHAHNRDIYAKGALRAAHWLLNQPAGRYTLTQVLHSE